MISFPNAKINLGLHVVEKRTDGFHSIETLFYPVALHDILEVVPGKADNNHDEPVSMRSNTSAVTPDVTLTTTGIPIPGNPNENLVLRAVSLFQDHYLQESLSGTPASFNPLPLSLQVHLHKVIPLGAGLGGGSADAAFMLKMLNDLYAAGYPVETLLDMAGRLGSDCPFFLLNKPVLATGRGDRFTPFTIDLTRFDIRFRFPSVHVSTPAAYAMVTPRKPNAPLQEILSLPVDQWRGRLVNDFEEPVMQRYPAIREAREALYTEGALYAAMSGSGSAVFGLFPGTT